MTGRAREYDYPALKLQWVRGTMSLRQLADKNNVRSPSTLIKVARDENWQKDRDDYRSRSTDKTLELLADREARRNLRVAEVVDDTIDMVGEAVAQVRGRMRTLRPIVIGKDADGEDIVEYDPELKISPKDLGNLLKGLAEIPGVAAPREREGKPGAGATITIPEGSDFAIMSKFVRDVRSAGGPAALEEGALPSGAEGAG